MSSSDDACLAESPRKKMKLEDSSDLNDTFDTDFYKLNDSSQVEFVGLFDDVLISSVHFYSIFFFEFFHLDD